MIVLKPYIIPFAAMSILAISLLSCNPTDRPKEAAGIMLSVGPQYYFTNQLIHGIAPVYVMIPPGASPATFEPAPSDIARLENAIAYFRIGYVGFELAWMDRIRDIYPDLPTMDVSEGITLIRGHNHTEEEGHEGHGHASAGVDPHIWMSPKRAVKIASNTRDALIQLFPEAKDSIEFRYIKLIADIAAMDDSVRTILNDSANRSFAIFHPSLSYLAMDYDLLQISIENEGKEPNPAQLKEAIDHIGTAGVRTILVQREFNQEHAKVIADAAKIRMEMIDPLSTDWPRSLVDIAWKISK